MPLFLFVCKKRLFMHHFLTLPVACYREETLTDFPDYFACHVCPLLSAEWTYGLILRLFAPCSLGAKQRKRAEFPLFSSPGRRRFHVNHKSYYSRLSVFLPTPTPGVFGFEQRSRKAIARPWRHKAGVHDDSIVFWRQSNLYFVCFLSPPPDFSWPQSHGVEITTMRCVGDGRGGEALLSLPSYLTCAIFFGTDKFWSTYIMLAGPCTVDKKTEKPPSDSLLPKKL